MAITQLDTRSYELNVVIGKLNDNGTGLNNDFIQEIDNDTINSVTICNDIYETLPSVELVMSDSTEGFISKTAANGLDAILVNLSFEGNTLFHIFIIYDITEIDSSNAEKTYKIDGVSYLNSPMNNYIPFSGGDKDKSYSVLVEEYFNNSNFNLIKTDPFTHSDRMGLHITPVNRSFRDCINDMLMKAGSYNTGMYYCPYNLNKNSFELISIRSQFMNSNNLHIYNTQLVPTDKKMGEVEEITKNTQMNNYSKYFYFSDYVMNNYNPELRKWKKDPFNYSKYMNFFSTNFHEKHLKQSCNLNQVPPSNKFLATYKKEKASHEYQEVGEMLDEYTRLSNVVQFDCVGFIPRSVGDLFYLDVAKDTREYYKYHGMYIISKIYHVISKGKYSQNISLMRNFKFDEPKESK